MDVRPVDPRDIRWEERAPAYPVYFRRGDASSEHALTGAAEVGEVLRWAREHADGRGYTTGAVAEPPEQPCA
ncbi:MAG TPA: hypothetical protein VF186_02780 [Gaiellaceae bacterium]